MTTKHPPVSVGLWREHNPIEARVSTLKQLQLSWARIGIPYSCDTSGKRTRWCAATRSKTYSTLVLKKALIGARK